MTACLAGMATSLTSSHPHAGAAELCVSELATNGVTHTRSGLPGGTLVVTVTVEGGTVTVAVGDQGADGTPAAAAPAPGAEHGYGLRLVAELAAGWGTSEAAGRTWCWCRFGGAR